jgi:hypothetical protein
MEDLPRDRGYFFSIISGIGLFSIASWIGYRFVLPDKEK